jgi:CheY-like chemotaxis protein/HAMP domain-containing protein
MKFGDYKIGTRLLAGFALMLVLSVAIGGTAFFQIKHLSELTENMYEHPFAVNTALRDLRRQIQVVDSVLADLAPGISTVRLETKKREIENAEKDIRELFQVVNARYLGDKNELRLAQESFREWSALIDHVFGSHTENLDQGAQINAVSDARRHGREFLSELQVMIDFAGNKAKTYNDKALSERDASFMLMGWLLGLSLLTAAGTAMLISRGISAPLRQVTNRIKEVAVGDLGDTLDMPRRDEIGELARAFATLRESLKEKILAAQAVAAGDLRREAVVVGERDALGIAMDRMIQALRSSSEGNAANDWVKTGGNELSARLTGEMDMKTLANGVIRFLAPYLNAQIGAFYVQGDDGILNLAGGYAFTKREGLSESFLPGQGLVGQAAREGKPISLTRLPEDYIRVHSALGDARPRNLLLVPLQHEGQVKGVLELGAFEEFTDVHLAFLVQASEAIGQAIATVENQARLRELLEQTRLQTQALQSQQEELSSTNEELEQQAQVLRSSEEGLQVANEELAQKNDYLERQKSEISLKNAELDNIRRGLEHKAAELELSSRYKSEFLANMSHELRTPLNSLLLLSRNLMDNPAGNLTAEQVEYARIIFRSGNDLLNLINEILSLSKIEAGKMTLNVDEANIADMAASLTGVFKPMADEKRLTLSVDIDEGLPTCLRTDAQRLEQILRNLLSNAVKFCDQGGVSLRFHRPEPEWKPGRGGLSPEEALAVTVADTGIGIPQDKHLEIFEAFQQLEGGTARKYGGTGLGLTISRELAHLLGGEIQLRSQPGEGASFTLFLPLDGPAEADGKPQKARKILFPPKSAPQAPAPAFIPDDRASLREKESTILIIEDDPDFAKILADQCHAKGFQVLAASTGEEGLMLARNAPPSAMILDIRLPGMNGWQALEELKHDPALRHIPVHIMSGTHDDMEALRRGAVGFLSKPVSREGLEQAFARIEEVLSKKIKTLLLVEDDDDLRRALLDLIREPTVNIVEASTGSQALALLKERRFDCVILDLGLPDMSGFDVLEGMDAALKAALPPVIVYTGRELTRDEERRLQTHADSIIIKGVRSEERLIDETSLFLHQMVASMPARKQDAIMRLYDKEAVFKDRTALLVDDDMRNLFALSQALQGKGMTTIKAEDGQKALDVLKGESKVDIILMDIMMPGMDGFETIRRIRAQKAFQSLPILAVTAKAMPQDREKCIEAGASDYLSKPVDLDRLLSLMRVWLHK